MNGNRLVNLLGDLAWPKVLAAGVLVGGLYYLTGYDDGSALQQRVESVTAEVSAAKISLAQTKKAASDADKFEKEVKSLSQQFERIHEFMPDNLGPAMLTDLITTQATQASASLIKLEPALATGLVDDKGIDFCEPSRMQFSLEGSYAQLETFLANLSKIEKILTLEQVKIVHVSGEIDRPLLSLTGILIGYKYKAPKKPVDAQPAQGDAANAKP